MRIEVNENLPPVSNYLKILYEKGMILELKKCIFQLHFQMYQQNF